MMNETASLLERLTHRGVSRREFLTFCLLMATTLHLPRFYARRIARALADAPRVPLIWLSFQDCAGDSESLLRAADPGVTDLAFEVISLDYHEMLMVPAGDLAEHARRSVIREYPGRYICVVEGSIPTAEDGIHCVIGGRTALSIAQETCRDAMLTIAVGSCAWDGGIAAASPNPSGAVGVNAAVPDLPNLVVMPGCPTNGLNLVAAIVWALTFGELPPMDAEHRPLFAYGDKIHSHCERRAFFKAKQFVRTWGDEGHRKGWCLLHMGCRGPYAYSNCYLNNWNGSTSWPVRAGHSCIGCVVPQFWDRMTPFYKRNLVDVPARPRAQEQEQPA